MNKNAVNTVGLHVGVMRSHSSVIKNLIIRKNRCSHERCGVLTLIFLPLCGLM